MPTVGVLSTLHGDVLSQVLGLWRWFATKYGAKGVATYDSPNVSFQGGVCCHLDGLKCLLAEVSHELVPFDLILDGFGCFETTRTIYLRAVPTAELLAVQRSVHSVLASACSRIFEDYRPERWIPHVTVAMSDLNDAGFRDAMQRLGTRRPRYHQTLSNMRLVQLDEATGRIHTVTEWPMLGERHRSA